MFSFFFFFFLLPARWCEWWMGAGGEHAASTETKRRTRPVTPEPIHRQWIWFIGFYTRSIIKAFCSTANEMGCTGFLMPGKPAVAAVEATAEVIAEFLKVTRTELFARVRQYMRGDIAIPRAGATARVL